MHQYFFGSIFYSKEKGKKVNLIKLKAFVQQRKLSTKQKDKPTEWEKIFPNDNTNKETTSNIY